MEELAKRIAMLENMRIGALQEFQQWVYLGERRRAQEARDRCEKLHSEILDLLSKAQEFSRSEEETKH